MDQSTAKSPAKTTRAPKPATTGETASGETVSSNTAEAKAKFTRALEEAKAGAAALTAEAKSRADGYRSKAADRSGDWVEDAKAYGEQAKMKASELAVEGKSRASDALSSLGKLVSDNAATIDDKLGIKYGDYARSASRKMQETAAKIEAKELDELGEDAREFVRKSPGLAVGLAAVAGFMIARMFSSSK